MPGDLPRRVFQCFGGPADGQLHEATLASGPLAITGRLFFFDLDTMAYRGTVILHMATYDPDILPLGVGNSYHTRSVLRWRAPKKREEDDGA